MNGFVVIKVVRMIVCVTGGPVMVVAGMPPDCGIVVTSPGNVVRMRSVEVMIVGLAMTLLLLAGLKENSFLPHLVEVSVTVSVVEAVVKIVVGTTLIEKMILGLTVMTVVDRAVMLITKG